VQHSTDGTDWYILSEVTAVGESEGNQFYDFTHQAPLGPVNYYRLRIVNNVDTYQYSGVIIIEINNEGDRELNVFPNPIAKDASLGIQLSGDWSTDQRITADLYDVQGRLLTKLPGLAGGTTSSLALPRGLKGGIYLLRINQGQHSADRRIIIR